MTVGQTGRRPVVAIDCRAATRTISGVGRYIINLVENLSSLERFHLALIGTNDLHPRLASLDGVTIVPAGPDGSKTGYVDRFRFEQRTLSGLLEASGASLFHATWNYGVPWRSPCPAVATVHDLLPVHSAAEFGARSHRAAFLTGQYLTLLKARRLIAVSGGTAREIRKYAPWTGRRTRVIYEAVDGAFSPGAGPRAGDYLLYVGGFDPRKNLARLFAAYHLISRDGIELPLKITGSRHDLTTGAAEQFEGLPVAVRERVVFIGRQDAALPDLYRGAAAFVFPSMVESFGFPPLEAMACGVPVVTTRCGSIPEIVGDAACLVDAEDPQSIAAGITRVLRDAGFRDGLIARGLQRASGFSWSKAAAETASVYEECLSGTPHAASRPLARVQDHR